MNDYINQMNIVTFNINRNGKDNRQINSLKTHCPTVYNSFSSGSSAISTIFLKSTIMCHNMWSTPTIASTCGSWGLAIPLTSIVTPDLNHEASYCYSWMKTTCLFNQQLQCIARACGSLRPVDELQGSRPKLVDYVILFINSCQSVVNQISLSQKNMSNLILINNWYTN